MTMPNERTRALVWAGGFLIEIARDKALPLALRRQAVSIARHFPTIEQVGAMSTATFHLGMGPGLVDPDAHPEWAKECLHGPLTYRTRLGWPEEQPGADGRAASRGPTTREP
ncbi:BPSL0761 family protein [Novilysobacter arseniciresistens]|uniref:BPSL0761 family protein n=1 Tax=Novilysobacter arseniciresistens TaxID=1385522 RepID=UPI0009DF7370